MNKKVDIIIPVYKAQKTLFKCLASIAAQTMSDDVQVILVQDGDGKDYSSIIDAFDLVLEILHINLPENKGPGYARQTGIEAGTSPYIMFIDSDDVLYSALSIEYLWSSINKTGKNIIGSRFLSELNYTIDDSRYLESDGVNPWVFAKIFSRDFIKRFDIKFSPTYMNEDIFFIMQCEAVCEPDDLEYIDRFTYLWRFNQDSLTRYQNEEKRKQITIDALTAQINNNIEFKEWLLKKIPMKDFNLVSKEWLLNLIFKFYLDYLYMVQEESPEYQEDIMYHAKPLLKKYLKEVFYPLSQFVGQSELTDIYSRVVHSYEKNTTGGKRNIPICSFQEYLKIIEE
jgi:glycosyltransferase involved in cell wall biosynthesis